jgi:hypothetical protein
MAARTASFLSTIGSFWRSFAHNDLTVRGRYQCRRCLRYHSVVWERNAVKHCGK